MKLKSKGMTLIELLITIVIVGIILLFMFTLLNELKNETDNNNFAYNNQTNKVDAIHAVQKDLNNYVLLGIKDVSVNDLKIEFYYLKGNENRTAVLSSSNKTTTNALGKSITKYYLNYYNVDREENSWEMKDAVVDSCGLFTFYKEDIVEHKLNNYYFKLNIYLYNSNFHEQNNKNNNNVIDDIEITYAGYNTYLENNTSFLTNSNITNKKIGKCTN